MPKHAVPKKKTSKGRTSRRYKDYANKVVKRLLNRVNLEDCPNCSEKKMIHQVCKACGTYKGKQILDNSKKVEKITKIKA